jgi:hypothetical protein
LTPPVNDGFNKIDPAVDNVSDIDSSVKAAPLKIVAAKDGEATDAEKAAKDAAEKADNERFDKHPRFQELMKERDTFKQELAAIKAQMEVLAPKAAAKEEKVLPFKNITTMTKEQLLEWQEDDPVGYAANLYQQMLHETREAIKVEQAEAQRTNSLKGTYEKYQKDNPDFIGMWNSGELQKFMDENPGHNAISAHKELTEKARIDAAVAKAVKEATEKVQKDFQAKRNAEVISDGGTVKVVDGVPDELKNPDKYGGVTQTLAGRLARLRQAAMGG